jgi:hypothetical protein
MSAVVQISAGPYLVGEAPTFSIVVTDADTGAPYDPATVTLSMKDPAGSITSPTVSNTGVGLRNAVVTLTSAGPWQGIWTASGGTKANTIKEAEFIVQAVPKLF